MSEWNPAANGIFAEAIEIDSANERAAFLNRACADNAELRAGVERLLEAHRAAGSFLERPANTFLPTLCIGEFDTADDGGAEIALDFLKPSTRPGSLGALGAYEVIEVIGRGGMGLVLRAHDSKLNRVVAIKALAPEWAAHPMAVKRFLREARAAAAVSHDHVITIHAIEEDYRPPFIVMEFVDGCSLQEKIDRRGALDVTEVLRIGIQMARGLSAAHEQGLVHRDIKPANILLENGVERVKITDFGLARAVDDVSVTQTGQIAGTPQFMSPEQAQGQPIDARSDLFSLGSVLYTMCTGRPPFRAETAVAMLRRVADDEPRSIREVNSETPAWLEAIVFKLLAKQADDRFRSAEEVAELLSRHLAHLQSPVTAPRPQPVLPPVREPRGDPVKPVRKPDHKRAAPRAWALVAIAAAALLVAVAALGRMVYLATDYGTLVIESDEHAEITIGKVPSDTHQGFRFSVVEKVTGSRILRLRSGHYRILAFDPNNPPQELEFQLSKEQFVLARGGKVVVRVDRIERREPSDPSEAAVQEAEMGQLKVLDRWIGSWQLELREQPTPDFPRAVTTRHTAHDKWILDNRYILGQTNSESGDEQLVTLTTFDQRQGGYRHWLFSSTGFAVERTGAWDDASSSMAWQTKPLAPGMQGSFTERFVSPDRRETKLVVRDGHGRVTRAIDGTAMRTSQVPSATLREAGSPASEPEELVHLASLTGDWSLDSTFRASVAEPEGNREATRERVRWVLGGRFVLGQSYLTDDRMILVWLMTYDPAESAFWFWVFHANGAVGKWRVTWEQAARTYHFRAVELPEGWIGSGFLRWIGNDALDRSIVIKDDQGRVLMDLTQIQRRTE